MDLLGLAPDHARVDYSAVEYTDLYEKLQAKAGQTDSAVVHWIQPEDKTVFHSNREDIEELGKVVTGAKEDWWHRHREKSSEDECFFSFPVPMQPNSTLYFMDWVYQYTGFDLNENTSLLYWQSRLTYFSPIYHLLYPLILFLIGFLTYTMVYGPQLTIWQFLAQSVSSFLQALRGGVLKACSALFRPVMYFYGLYESLKSRHIHHKAVSETTEFMQKLIGAWSDRFYTVKQFCQKAEPFLQEENEEGHGYFRRSVFESFHKIEGYFTKLLEEYSYLVDPQTTSAHLYENLGKTLALRWQLTFTEKYRIDSSCQAAVRILKSLASKVAIVRMWNILFRDHSLVQSVSWVQEEQEEKMIQSKYPFLLLRKQEEEEEEAVGNDCFFGNSNSVITGPNATGKTTFLKSVILNLLFAHHCGVGFFQQCQLSKPFHHFLCYINVPDTSDRDSLFQAEAAQSLEMLRLSESANKQGKRSFAIFDELFTGTNPEDASLLTCALLDFLGDNPSLRFLCTTHFTRAIDQMRLREEEEGEEEEGERKTSTPLRYLQTDFDSLTGRKTFLLKPGVSRESNVLKVLADLNYPSVILDKFRVL